MSSIDFQNGFICGLATRGLTVNTNGTVDKYTKLASASDVVEFPELVIIDSAQALLELYFDPSSVVPEPSPTCSDIIELPSLSLTDVVTVTLYE